MNKIEELKRIIEESKSIVFFGGAGVSTASGIPDFRGAKGIYTYTPEEVVSHSFFFSHTKEFYDFYWSKLVFKNAEPSECHYFLAELEKRGKLLGVITQNIDSLHQKAGSKNVIELHGSTNRYTCIKCKEKYELFQLDCFGIPTCKKCGGLIKPDVILYDEALSQNDIFKAIEMISKADTLIVGGTSLVVYPAAGLVKYFVGKCIIEINYDETYITKDVNLSFKDDINRILDRKIIKK